MKVSVITPLYHGKKYIPNMIQQVKKASAFVPFVVIEHLFINDAPEEQITKEEVEIQEQNYESHLFSNSINQGIHASRVMALKKATGDYLLFLDQDDRIAPNYFASQLSRIGTFDVIVANGYQAFETKNVPIYRTYQKHQEAISYKGYQFRSAIISPGQCLIRRTSISDIWMHHPMQANGSDDYLLWILLLNEQCSFQINPDFLYYHTMGDQNFSNNDYKMKCSSLEAYQLLKTYSFIPSKIKKYRRFNQALIGRNYSIWTNLKGIICYPDVFYYKVYDSIKRKW